MPNNHLKFLSTLLHDIIQWEQWPAFSHISCIHQNMFVLKYSIGRDFYVNSILLSKRQNKNLKNSLLLDTHTFQKSVDKHHRSLEEWVSNWETNRIVKIRQIMISNFFQPSATYSKSAPVNWLQSIPGMCTNTHFFSPVDISI